MLLLISPSLLSLDTSSISTSSLVLIFLFPNNFFYDFSFLSASRLLTLFLPLLSPSFFFNSLSSIISSSESSESPLSIPNASLAFLSYAASSSAIVFGFLILVASESLLTDIPFASNSCVISPKSLILLFTNLLDFNLFLNFRIFILPLTFFKDLSRSS